MIQLSCPGLLEKVFTFNEVAIVCVKNMNYYIHLLFMAKDQAINMLKNNAWKSRNERL